MPSPRQELLRLLAHKSFKLGEFKLSSGATSDYYIDCRTTTLDAAARNSPAGFSRRNPPARLESAGHRGLTMGADPIVVAVRSPAATRAAFWSARRRSNTAPGSASKGSAKGRKVVIVDDVCTTGASTIQAIEAAREFGFEVSARCAWSSARRRRRANVEKAAAPRPSLRSSPPTMCARNTFSRPRNQRIRRRQHHLRILRHGLP